MVAGIDATVSTGVPFIALASTVALLAEVAVADTRPVGPLTDRRREYVPRFRDQDGRFPQRAVWICPFHDFLAVDAGSVAANDLFAVLADAERRLPKTITALFRPAYWPETTGPGDSLLDRHPPRNYAPELLLGGIDMRRLRDDQVSASTDHWE